MFRGKNQHQTILPYWSQLLRWIPSVHYIHEYVPEMPLHRFHSSPAEKDTHMDTWQKHMWLPSAHLRYLCLMAARRCMVAFMIGVTALSSISRQMHHQNSAATPPESRGATWTPCTPAWSCLHLQRGSDDRQRKVLPSYILVKAEKLSPRSRSQINSITSLLI